MPPYKWVKIIENELDAGSWKVICEARESGTVGVFRPNGEVRSGLIEEITDQISKDNLIFEAPQKDQQIWFIKKFGSNVNLGNIKPDEVISVETLRLGLRGDTLLIFTHSIVPISINLFRDDQIRQFAGESLTIITSTMKILYAATEIAPFARMTYTADLLRFLPASLQDEGFEIRILLPKFGSINDRRNRLHEVIRLSGIEVEVGGEIDTMKIKVASIPNAKLQVYFLDNDKYFKSKAMFDDPKTGNFMRITMRDLPFTIKACLKLLSVSDGNRILFTVMIGRPD